MLGNIHIKKGAKSNRSHLDQVVSRPSFNLFLHRPDGHTHVVRIVAARNNLSWIESYSAVVSVVAAGAAASSEAGAFVPAGKLYGLVCSSS
jgi:hypothetical protein